MPAGAAATPVVPSRIGFGLYGWKDGRMSILEHFRKSFDQNFQIASIFFRVGQTISSESSSPVIARRPFANLEVHFECIIPSSRQGRPPTSFKSSSAAS